MPPRPPRGADLVEEHGVLPRARQGDAALQEEHLPNGLGVEAAEALLPDALVRR